MLDKALAQQQRGNEGSLFIGEVQADF